MGVRSGSSLFPSSDDVWMAIPTHRYLPHLVAAAFSLLLFSPSALGDDHATILENRVKAGCLYNFAVNTKWPNNAFGDAEDPFVIGFFGETEFRSVLEKGIQGKTINGRTIEVRTIDTPEDAETCHLVFVSAQTEQETATALLTLLASKPVLTVGDGNGFAMHGGILNFTKVDGRVRFEVNRKAVKRAGVKLGSQLLKLAILVDDSVSLRLDYQSWKFATLVDDHFGKGNS